MKPSKLWQPGYQAALSTVSSQLRNTPATTPIRIAKKTSNLFRDRAEHLTPGLDVSHFAKVFHVDPVTRTAEVGGMTTYEDLVAATLPYGLMPLCVPQLRTITLGGAVTGLGIESASFRNGTPHESVIEMDILTRNGRGAHRHSRQRRPPTEAFSLHFPIHTGHLVTPCD